MLMSESTYIHTCTYAHVGEREVCDYVLTIDARVNIHVNAYIHIYAFADLRVLQVGDFVLRIDGAKTSGRSHSELVDLIMGPPNSTVELEVERESDGTILTIEVLRETTARRDRSMVSG